jgi:hypothetical protein
VVLTANALSAQAQVPLMVNGESAVRDLTVHGLVVAANLTMNATVTIPDQPTMDGAALGRVGGTDCAIKSCVTKKH